MYNSVCIEPEWREGSHVLGGGYGTSDYAVILVFFIDILINVYGFLIYDVVSFVLTACVLAVVIFVKAYSLIWK